MYHLRGLRNINYNNLPFLPPLTPRGALRLKVPLGDLGVSYIVGTKIITKEYKGI